MNLFVWTLLSIHSFHVKINSTRFIELFHVFNSSVYNPPLNEDLLNKQKWFEFFISDFKTGYAFLILVHTIKTRGTTRSQSRTNTVTSPCV